MSITNELDTLIMSLGLSVETGKFSGAAPAEYVVITPLGDSFRLHSDNQPAFETQEVRLSLFCMKNYLARKRLLEKALLKSGFTITLRRYNGFNDGYHGVTIDTQKLYEWSD